MKCFELPHISVLASFSQLQGFCSAVPQNPSLVGSVSPQAASFLDWTSSDILLKSLLFLKLWLKDSLYTKTCNLQGKVATLQSRHKKLVMEPECNPEAQYSRSDENTTIFLRSWGICDLRDLYPVSCIWTAGNIAFPYSSDLNRCPFTACSYALTAFHHHFLLEG